MNEFKEYAIKHAGYYIQEGNTFGLCYHVKELNNASTFPTRKNALDYVSEMCLNPRSITLVEVTTIKSTEEQVLIGNEWVNASDVEQCTVCLKNYPRTSLTKYQQSRHSEVELVCELCLDFMERNFPNQYDNRSDNAKCFDEQMGNPLGQLEDIIGGLHNE